MTLVSEKAFAISATCSKTRMPYGISVDEVGSNQYKFVWAFKIDAEKAHREGYDTRTVNGSIAIDDEFPGCPHCGAREFYSCSSCGSIVCYHNEEYVTCPKCGASGTITRVESIKLHGGGY